MFQTHDFTLLNDGILLISLKFNSTLKISSVNTLCTLLGHIYCDVNCCTLWKSFLAAIFNLAFISIYGFNHDVWLNFIILSTFLILIHDLVLVTNLLLAQHTFFYYTYYASFWYFSIAFFIVKRVDHCVSSKGIQIYILFHYFHHNIL